MLFFKDVSVGKLLSSIIFHRLDKEKNAKVVFCEKLSNMPWFNVYQCSTRSGVFDMYVCLVSTVVEKRALLEKVFLRRKTPDLFSEKLSKNSLLNAKSPKKGNAKTDSLKIGLLLAKTEGNSQVL